ncbi:MAG: DMT family transporter [Desulfofustis sp. PB-SRB1]|jgi:drug/metabolite transporter (DMT)-like permease|nr:DMT family transporter [Desulfofustis sp. PB-SRB1]MBM1002663.1 DMT family transporter [Desulfofustis sp. PB-SRB1]HBH29976.1 EamA/RhaT family transporter [Desulfofustis sp.]HBH31991.1 EamA/RhaT family transporter [Desulfofustis sp.]
MPSNAPPYSALLCAFFSAVLMATIGVFSKLTGLPAEIITFFRLFLGAAFMGAFAAATGAGSSLKGWPCAAVLINGAFLAGFIIFYVQAMNHTTMANAIMLIYLAPPVASVVAHFFMGERLTPLSVSLILLALLGFGMMMEFNIEISSKSREFIGVGLGLAAMTCYAGFILNNRLISASVHVYNRTFYAMLAGACLMLPWAAGSFSTIGTDEIPWLFGIGLFPGFLAILLAVVALSRLSAATFGTIAYTEPVAVVVFGWTLFGQHLNTMQAAGCALIIISGIAKTLLSTTESGDAGALTDRSC